MDSTSIKSFAKRGWFIFFVSTSLFVLSQFYRASIAVITPELMTEISLDTGGLSLTTSAFFYAFALTQIPIGMSLDRLGPRVTMTVLNVVGVVGAVVFARAETLNALVAGRILLGIGMACNLMGTFKLLTLWFDPMKFATLSAFVFSIGTGGNLVATTPLVLLVQQFGWRHSFFLFAMVNLMLAFLFFIVVRDRPPDSGSGSTGSRIDQSFTDIFSGLGRLFAMRDFWIISTATFCHYGIYAAIQTLWAGPYLMGVAGLSPVAAGNLILLLNLGFIAGGPFWGLLSDRLLKSRKNIVVIGIVGMAGCLGALAFLSVEAAMSAMAMLFLLCGLFRSAGGVMYAHIKDLMPENLSGTAMTGINFFTMIGPAVFLQAMGWLMLYLYPADSLGPGAFRAAFLFCVGCLVLIFMLYLFTRDGFRKT